MQQNAAASRQIHATTLANLLVYCASDLLRKDLRVVIAALAHTSRVLELLP